MADLSGLVDTVESGLGNTVSTSPINKNVIWCASVSEHQCCINKGTLNTLTICTYRPTLQFITTYTPVTFDIFRWSERTSEKTTTGASQDILKRASDEVIN
jgi:hypothetical protein